METLWNSAVVVFSLIFAISCFAYVASPARFVIKFFVLGVFFCGFIIWANNDLGYCGFHDSQGLWGHLANAHSCFLSRNIHHLRPILATVLIFGPVFVWSVIAWGKLLRTYEIWKIARVRNTQKRERAQKNKGPT